MKMKNRMPAITAVTSFSCTLVLFSDILIRISGGAAGQNTIMRADYGTYSRK